MSIWLKFEEKPDIFYIDNKVFDIDWGIPPKSFESKETNGYDYMITENNYDLRIISFSIIFDDDINALSEYRKEFIRWMNIPENKKLYLYRDNCNYVERILIKPSSRGGEKYEDVYSSSDIGYKCLCPFPFFERVDKTIHNFSLSNYDETEIKFNNTGDICFPIIRFIPSSEISHLSIIQYVSFGIEFDSITFQSGSIIEIDFNKNFETFLKINGYIRTDWLKDGSPFYLDPGENIWYVKASPGILTIEYNETGL